MDFWDKCLETAWDEPGGECEYSPMCRNYALANRSRAIIGKYKGWTSPYWIIQKGAERRRTMIGRRRVMMEVSK